PGLGVEIRYQFATAKLAGGATRMYLGIGSTENPFTLWRTDDARTAAPAWQELSSPDPADPGSFASYDICPGQCWYDLFVGSPDVMFVGNDGGVIRTSGQYADDSAACDARGLTGTDLTDCKAWLSKIPTRLITLNAGLNTLQFQSLSVDWQNPLNDLLGGTQDNGTLAYTGSPTWLLPVTGDGGDSGIDPAHPATRFHTYTNADMDVNFHGNTPKTWDWIADQLFFSPDLSAFYAPATQDPVVSGQIFVGYEHVYRTQDSGGDPAFLDAHCNTTGQFGTGDKHFSGQCGDFKVVSPN